ncbi:hypothetical protein HC931_25470 [Candidatus Gracilibacteria bacterium]|nr:hypothetical protein [Candidatus Gracilibacteria bacterium]NJM90696.1 hypothetical protein [Hydrococcus sp. RU_2_2]NJP21855.1 hypothetical protein [Hydrococcus sp. CRU_1_1]
MARQQQLRYRFLCRWRWWQDYSALGPLALFTLSIHEAGRILWKKY